VLIINRSWNLQMRRQSIGSKAGEWFRHQSTKKLREMYVHPQGIDGLDLHLVDFDKLLTDASELEALLQWIGLLVDPANQFTNFLDRVGVES
jgi:hypothetical protein